MPYTLADVEAVIEELWPTEFSESWDATGRVVGSQSDVVRTVVLMVDPVSAPVSEAISQGADLIISHHPLLLRGVTSVSADSYKGSIVRELITNSCALISAHTNADITSDGVSASLARAVGLSESHAIVPGVREGTGLGRVGTLGTPTTLGSLARALARILPATATGIRVAGEFDRQVSRVALCGGAGDSLLDHPEVRAADVYITADLRHHPASEAREAALMAGGTPALIDVSHWASEWLWLDVAAAALRKALPELTVITSEIRSDPWDFVITQ